MKFFSLLILIILVSSADNIAGNMPPLFQQQANHILKVKVIDSLRTIDVDQTLEYINNSPDTLHQIYIHLWANALSNNTTQFAKQLVRSRDYSFHFSKANQKGGYSRISFETQGRKMSWGNYRNHDDIAVLFPEKPLMPGTAIIINIRYSLIFPDASFSRPGMTAEAIYATQWYPKPAVYDHNGWHPMPYLHRGEFYSDFGNYIVAITLPSDYLVASSGILTDQDEINHLMRLSQKTKRLGADAPDIPDAPASTASETKTLHFYQENIHDFAWFADKRFRVLVDSVQLAGGEKVQLFSFFTHNQQWWLKANAIMGETIGYMSQALGPYPWKQMTAVQANGSGGANMEYPAITLLDKPHSFRGLEEVLVHETIHNWFYGILASNERAEAWIDEGFTTYYENRILNMRYPDQKLLGPLSRTSLARYFHLSNISGDLLPYLHYMMKAAQRLDQPPATHTEEMSAYNYYAMTYFKAAMSIHLLENYLGRAAFDEIMQHFYSEWKFRHPTGTDLKQHFESYAGTGWFFEDLIASDKKIDLALVSTEALNDGYLITIRNKGNGTLPFPVTALRNGQPLQTQWFEGFPDTKQLYFPGGTYDFFVIDYQGLLPEIDRSNNSRKTSGLFRKPFNPELRFLAHIDNPQVSEIYWAPVVGYNTHDGFMTGLAFYNYSFPVKRNDIFLMPFYSPGRDGISGMAWYYRDIYPGSSFIHSFRAGFRYKSYGLRSGLNDMDYIQYKTSLKATFHHPLSDNRKETFAEISNYIIDHDRMIFSSGAANVVSEKFYANRLDLYHANASTLNPYSMNVELLQAKQMLRASVTGTILLPRNKELKGLSLRFFAGAFIIRPHDASAPDFRFSLQGMGPRRDVLYDHTIIARNHRPGALLANQTTGTYGNFKIPTPLGLNWHWLTALNVLYDIPQLPLRVFVDTGTYHGAGNELLGSEKIPFVAGIQIPFMKDVVSLNLPLLMSADIKKVAELNGLNDFHQRITFFIDFQKINPMEARRKLHLLLN
jgi:hypothetical protein